MSLADDRCDGSASNTDESVLTRLTNRRTMACQLKFDTPCILRKRKRRSPQATRRNDVRFGSCEYKDSSCLLTASELSPRSEAPFTPSRVSVKLACTVLLVLLTFLEILYYLQYSAVCMYVYIYIYMYTRLNKRNIFSSLFHFCSVMYPD